MQNLNPVKALCTLFLSIGMVILSCTFNQFDMMNDPGELQNLWDDPDHQEIKESPGKRMDSWFDEIDKPAELFETINP